MKSFEDHLKSLPKQELIDMYFDFCKSARHLKELAKVSGLNGQVAAANYAEIQKHVELIEKVGKRRRIIK